MADNAVVFNCAPSVKDRRHLIQVSVPFDVLEPGDIRIVQLQSMVQNAVVQFINYRQQAALGGQTITHATCLLYTSPSPRD